MAAPKSNEGKAARKIADAVSTRGLNNDMIAYYIQDYTTTETRGELFDVFMHLVRRTNDSPMPERMTADEARFRLLCESIVRAVDDAGMYFN